ncbi:MAG: 16S rRNA (uracil(1498)-N(3))-methyltransferase [Rhodobacteraceae bacterium]|nr:MAG: 16S rRNA (uracil(1498)-N(3))-methyltransferase [Paracoccaceae bacterium]
MAKKRAKIRLFVEGTLGEGQGIVASKEQANYLFNVMRLKIGDNVLLFNGRDGEWQAEVVEAGKRAGKLACRSQTAPLQLPPDLWLLFAPIKKSRTAFIVEKATELGAARIMPVLTDFTNMDKIQIDRLRAYALEATEQCGGTFIPEVCDIQKLSDVLDDWPEDRHIMFCDESREALPVAQALAAETKGKWAIVIGPEGGFSPAEAERLRGMKQVTCVTLGPRILRADTAAVAALTAWQSALGDWE